MPNHSIETLSLNLTRAGQCIHEVVDGVGLQIGPIQRAVVARGPLLVTVVGPAEDDGVPQEIKIALSIKAKDAATVVEEMMDRKACTTTAGSNPSSALAGSIPCKEEHLNPSNSSPRQMTCIPRSSVRHSGSRFSRQPSPQQSWRAGNQTGFR